MNGTQTLSIGQLLAKTREEKGINTEQAARDMRVKADRIREMEKDDISHFTHPSYARFFMRDYAQYLGLSPEDYAEYLPEAGSSISDGLEYLQYFNQVEVATRSDLIKSGRGMPSRTQAATRRAAGVGWVLFCVVAAAAIAGLFYLKEDFIRPSSPAEPEENAQRAVAPENAESEEAPEASAKTEPGAAVDFSSDEAWLLPAGESDASGIQIALEDRTPISLQQESTSPQEVEDRSLRDEIELQ